MFFSGAELRISTYNANTEISCHQIVIALQTPQSRVLEHKPNDYMSNISTTHTETYIRAKLLSNCS